MTATSGPVPTDQAAGDVDGTADTIRTIDAHQHFWRAAEQDRPWRSDALRNLDRDFLPPELEPQLDAAGVAATVLVQSVDGPDENDRLAGFAANPRVAGTVAWLPLSSGRAALDELDRVAMPKLSGVRCLVGRDPLDWLSGSDVRVLFAELAARGLAWDVVPVTAAQVHNVVALARAVPDLPVVVDHLGRPPWDTGVREPWAELLTELAGCPNVVVKVSVGLDALSAVTAWDATALAPYVAHVVERFGPDRLMLASNWPVITLRVPYGRAWSDLDALLTARLPAPQDLAAVRGGTATRVYRLPAP